jgi:hypothetical protein
MSTSNFQRGEAKRRYSTPSLTVYGSVRDLTGAATGLRGDGGRGMQPAV